MATTSLRMTNSTLSKLIDEVSHGNYKRTWQGVSSGLLPYLYYTYMVCANDKYACSNVYVLFMSLLYYFHKVNIFQIYDFILCDTSCDHSHVPLHCLRNWNWKSNQRKWRKWKENEKILKFKHTMTKRIERVQMLDGMWYRDRKHFPDMESLEVVVSLMILNMSTIFIILVVLEL